MLTAKRLSGAYPKIILMLSQSLHCYLSTVLLVYTDGMGEPIGYVSTTGITLRVTDPLT
jgi:hypothetical protein